jgi:hypothetical protein
MSHFPPGTLGRGKDQKTDVQRKPQVPTCPVKASGTYMSSESLRYRHVQ